MFVELPKFTKSEPELISIKEQWLYFLQKSYDLTSIPKAFDSEVQKALEFANKAGLSVEELEAQMEKQASLVAESLVTDEQEVSNRSLIMEIRAGTGY